jgi:hypothetical protein
MTKLYFGFGFSKLVPGFLFVSPSELWAIAVNHGVLFYISNAGTTFEADKVKLGLPTGWSWVRCSSSETSGGLLASAMVTLWAGRA